jgi:hypothetical protein
MQKIKVLYCPVEGDARIVEVDDDLQVKKELIGCDTIDMKMITEDGLCVMFDDEGRLTGKKTNPHLYIQMNEMFGLGLAGDFLVIRTDEEGEDISLTNEDIMYFNKILEVENMSEFKGYMKEKAQQEDEYVNSNPEVLAPKVYPINDIEEYFGAKKNKSKQEDDIVVTIPLKITKQFVDDVCTTAFEGGINYWCDAVRINDNDYKGGEYASDVISRGGSLTLVIDDAEDMDFEEQTITLTLDKFIKGFQQYANWAVSRNLEVCTDASDIDAELADVIIQFAVFDEIVFG